MNTGYFGGAATIGNMTVYYENRNGNASVKLAQSDTLKRAYKVLTDNGIKIRNSRMDAGSYSGEIIETVARNSQHFYIRAGRSRILTEQIQQTIEWQTVETNFKEYQVASIPFTQFFAEKNYRLIVAREKSDDRQLDLFKGEKFKYRCILTGETAFFIGERFNGEELCRRVTDAFDDDAQKSLCGWVEYDREHYEAVLFWVVREPEKGMLLSPENISASCRHLL
jgi:hypothetical protein